MWAIKTENLSKKFKELTAVDGVNLEIAEKECFGLLGPNGAGKTSLIRMLIAASPPTSGNIWILGKELKKFARQVKAVLGVVPQNDNLDPDLPVLQNLLTYSRFFDIPHVEALKRSNEVLNLFELDSKLRSQIKELSGGMKRRLLIARGLINQPQILILDEPTVGLDPQSRHLVWHKLRELKNQGVTQLLCTQNMEEAAALCDRVAIMYQGRVVSVGAPAKLIADHIGSELWEIEILPEEREELTRSLKLGGYDFEADGRRIQLFHVKSDKFVQDLAISPYRIKHRTATLEDVFFKLTGRTLNE
jgi:lipooligosaccharide transport system ATP-binding protein